MNINKPWKPVPRVLFSREVNRRPPADLVSVCVTNYNYGRYLPDCLQSLAEQTHKALDLVIVDDHSTRDDSVKEACAWLDANAAHFHRVVLLQHTRNAGPSEARNTAFRHALSSYVFVIDADNEVYPRAIGRLYAALIAGKFDATYSQLELFGRKAGIGSADIWDTHELYQRNYVDVMALVHKPAWEMVDGYSHIDEGWEDYDFWLKFVEAGLKAAYVPEILCRYRVHDESRTAIEAFGAHEDLKVIMHLRHPRPESGEGTQDESFAIESMATTPALPQAKWRKRNSRNLAKPRQ